MKIKFLGACGTVTGSSYALTSSRGQSILIDLGLFLGTRNIDKLNYEPFGYDGSKLSSVILTHAHLDHCGRLPILMPQGFRNTIWMTPATQDLTQLSLLDSVKVAKNEEKSILFDKKQAEETFTHFQTIEYRKPLHIGDFTITMRDAGHILGSAILEIVDINAESKISKIVFSGDLGNSPEDLLKETELIDHADVVVMESTYGDRVHPEAIPVDTIKSEINIIESTGGTLLIPAFALDRTQELLHILMHLKKSGVINSLTPIYLDSPMAEKATMIYDAYPAIFNSHIQSDLSTGSPFTFEGFVKIFKPGDSHALHEKPGPKIIIAGSGMMTGGRILSHAIHYLPIPSTRLFIVGYQGVGTLGRELLEGKKEVQIDQMKVTVKATINNTQSMSAHADQQKLIKWLRHIKNVKKVFLTHGDDEPRAALAQKISSELGYRDVFMPTMQQEFNL